MEVSDPQALQDKADEFNTFLNQEARPTAFTIGEMGDFLRRYLEQIMFCWCHGVIVIAYTEDKQQTLFFYSEEFLAARTAFADELRPRTMVIKDRTLRNNYASAYAVRMSKCFLKCLVVMFFFPHT